MLEPRIFISCSSKDDAVLPFEANGLGLADNLARQTKQQYFNKFGSKIGIATSYSDDRRSREARLEAVGCSNIMVTILSVQWAESDWCRAEYAKFLDRFEEAEDNSGFIIAVVFDPIDNSPLPPVMKHAPRVEFFEHDRHSDLWRKFSDPKDVEFERSVGKLVDQVHMAVTRLFPAS